MAEDDPKPLPDPVPTVVLSRRAARGDEEAFARLYERHFHRVLRVVALRSGQLLRNCQHEIEDAVHEAFTDTFARIARDEIPGIHTDGAFRAYVTTAAGNRIRTRARDGAAKKRGGNQVMLRADLVPAASDTESLFAMIQGADPTPSACARANEIEERLERMLLELEEPYKTAIELRLLCQMSNEEIAASGRLLAPRTGKPLTTREQVKVIVHRARVKLAPVLGPV